MIPRSQLVVPGNRPERFSKAAASGADSISLDLEDSVPPPEHDAARAAVADYLAASPPLPVTVRVVGVERREFDGDLEAVVGPNLTGVALPQVEGPDTLRHAAARLDALERERGVEPGRIRLHPGVESARGLRRLHDILTASARVGSASFQGARGGDLVRDLGATWSLEGRELLFVRSLVVFEARAAGIEQVFDGVFVDLDDDAGFEADTEAGRRLGYTGRVAIHPRQVAIVNRVHTPKPEALEAARALIAAFREAERDGVGAIRHRGLWVFHGRNKKSVTLDLRDPRGADVLRRLCARADVLIQSFRPQTVERYGLGYEQLAQVNERLVVVYVTGFGLTGPYAERPGFGTLAEAMSGFAHITGAADGPPTLPQFALADSVAALYGAFGVLNALYWRDALGGGRGQYVDLSLLEPLFSILGAHATMYDQLRIVAERTGSRIFANAPRNVYRAADGKWLAVAASVQQAARRCFEAIGRPELFDDPRFSTAKARVENVDEVDAIVGDWVGETTRDEALAILLEHEVPAAPVLDIADFLADPHVEARELVPAVEDPDLGPVRMQGVVPLLSHTPGRIARTGPRLGEHNDEVYRGLLGMADEELAELRGAGVV